MINFRTMENRKEAIREKRKLGCTMLVYILVLTVNLLVGSAVIIWKCVLSREIDEEECALATGGTVGSITIWLVLMLICPCAATKCDRESCKKKLSKYLEVMRLRKPRDVYIESEVYRPTTIAMVDITRKPEVKVEGLKGQQEDDSCSNERLLSPENGSPSHNQDVVYMFNETGKRESHVDSVT